MSANWIIANWKALERRPEIAINGFHKAKFLDSIDV